MVSRNVKDVFSRGFVSVREDDTLSSCLPLFKEEMPPVLVVLSSEGEYKGVIVRRCVIRSRLDPSTTKVETLIRPALTVTLHDSRSKVAEHLCTHKEEKLFGSIYMNVTRLLNGK